MGRPSCHTSSSCVGDAGVTASWEPGGAGFARPARGRALSSAPGSGLRPFSVPVTASRGARPVTATFGVLAARDQLAKFHKGLTGTLRASALAPTRLQTRLQTRLRALTLERVSGRVPRPRPPRFRESPAGRAGHPGQLSDLFLPTGVSARSGSPSGPQLRAPGRGSGGGSSGVSPVVLGVWSEHLDDSGPSCSPACHPSGLCTVQPDAPGHRHRWSV